MNHLNSGELVSLLLLDLEQYFVFLFAPVAAAAAKLLQSCLTLCDPIDGSPPGSPSLGFSRQEHWSELPFPSPMHESEKWKGSHSVVSNSSRPHGLQPTRLLLRPWDFPGKSTGVRCHCLLQNPCMDSSKSNQYWPSWTVVELLAGCNTNREHFLIFSSIISSCKEDKLLFCFLFFFFFLILFYF